MTKAWDEFPIRPRKSRPAPDGRVRVRFVVDCRYNDLPMTAGEEILVEPHLADRLEHFGAGRRVTDTDKES